MPTGSYCQTLIIHNNAGPLGTVASLPASDASLAAIPNVTLLEVPWVNGSGETDVTGGTPAWPYPKTVDGHRLQLEGPGLGIEARCTSGLAAVDEALAASKPFVSSLQVPHLRGPVE